MMNSFTRGMARATALTRSGRLIEATALIQSLMHPTQAALPPPEEGGDMVIEGVFTRADPTVAEQVVPVRSKPAKTRPLRTKLRSTLAETLRTISAGGMPARKGPARSVAVLTEGAQFLSLTHLSAQGNRDYRLYIPAQRGAGQMPLIVMLHGCTQTPEDFAVGTGMNQLAEELGLLIAYPAQPTVANVQKCWNWYRPEDQERDRGEPALIAGIARDILRDHAADPARLYVAGLSAGGAAAVLVAAAYPDLFSAVGVHSGLPGGAARDVASAFAAMRSGSSGKTVATAVPTIVFHGTADGTVHPSNGTAVLQQAVHAMPDLAVTRQSGVCASGRPYRTTAYHGADGCSHAEHWQIEGGGHAWSGGNPAGSYADANGPDASRQMIRFFVQHKKA